MPTPRLFVLLTSVWPFASLAACGPTKPPEPSVGPEPPAAVVTASSAPPMFAASSAPAPASSTRRPAPMVAPASSGSAPALVPESPFGRLLTKDKKVVYTLSEEVDTHDAHPGQGVAKRTGRVSFTITSVDRDGETWVGDGTWASEGTEEDLLAGGAPPATWRVRGASIEIAEDAEHVSLATEAKIATAPMNTVCHHAYEQAMYGRSHREICFDRQGLVRYIEENLHGPRTLRLVRSK